MKRPLTIRLSREARRALELLAQRDARSMSGTLEKLVQDKAKAEGVWVPQPLKSAS